MMRRMDHVSQAQSDILRRRLLTAGVASLAATAGAGAYWWRTKSLAQESNAETPGAATLPGVWEHTFSTPAGKALTMQALKGKPLLINFWATWCPPCVDELPLLESFYQKNAANGVQILGLAVDKAESVQVFLQKLPLSFPLGLAGTSGIVLSKSWGNLSGGLPFSVMLAADGRVMQRKMGKLSETDLSTWLTAIQISSEPFKQF